MERNEIGERAFEDGSKREKVRRICFSASEEKSWNRNFLRHSDLSMAGVKLNFPLWKVFN